MMMNKIDFKKTLKELYLPPRRPVLVDVPEMQFLMIDGAGPPENEEYQSAIQILYGVSFPMKFKLKKAGVVDYTVPPLEGLWWVEASDTFDISQRDDWRWTAMIMQPEQVTQDLVIETIEEVEEKKGIEIQNRLRLETFHEGRSAQIMHIGPYSAEGPTIQKLHDFIEAEGLSPRGKHHEIYLSDPRRAAPDRLKTVIRQPVS